METTNHPIVTSAPARASSCHGAGQDSGSWLSRRRGLVFGGGAIVAGTALALSHHWLAAAALAPLLYLLPCLALMYMCMKSMKHGEQASTAPASANADPSIGTDTARL